MSTSNPSPRPSWSGNIVFGGVPIGVKLISTCPDPEPDFKTVHAVDDSPLRRDEVCAKCAKTVTSAECVQAIADGAGGYVKVTEDELAALATKSRKEIVLEQFPARNTVAPILVEKVYYAVPATESDRLYFDVLRVTLMASSSLALGKIAFRSRERLATIVVDRHSVLVYITRFPHEIRDIPALPEWTMSVDSGLVDMAIDAMTAANKAAGVDGGLPNFAMFSDEYSEKLAVLTSRKRRGQHVPERGGNVVMLEKSLRAAATRARRSTVAKVAA